MIDLNLPAFDVPELPPKEMTFEDYCRWVDKYVQELLARGEYADIRDKLCQMPVDVRFEL